MGRIAFEPMSATELMRKSFPPAHLVVDGLVPAGLSLLAGRPKIGKSWFALDMALSVSAGAPFLGNATEQGSVLYLALEDGDRRVQGRLAKMLAGVTPPKDLFIQTECPALDEGGKEAIEGWIQGANVPRLVVVDVLQRIKPRPKAGSSYYAEDYASVLALKSLADAYDIGVIAVCHTRKAEAGMDPFDAISATTGLTGAADHAMVLDRTSTGIGLYGRGRDLDECDLSIFFDPDTARWSFVADLEGVGRSDTANAIIAALRQAPGPIGPGEIASLAGLPDNTVRQRLIGLVKGGSVMKAGRGSYALPSTTPPTPITTVTSVTNTSPTSTPRLPYQTHEKREVGEVENVTDVMVVMGLEGGNSGPITSSAPHAPNDDADDDAKYEAFVQAYERFNAPDLSEDQRSALRRNLELADGLAYPEQALLLAKTAPNMKLAAVRKALGQHAASQDSGGPTWPTRAE